MDVPNKWGLSEFLELADTVIKRYDLSRTDGFKQPPAMSRFGLSYTVCAFRKGPRVADSLLPHFQMPLGNAPRVRVLESIAAGAINPNRVCGLLAYNSSLGQLWLPPGRHVLGSDAAQLILPHIHASVRPHDRRSDVCVL